MQPPKASDSKRALMNMEDGANHGVAPVTAKQTTPLEMMPPPMDFEHSSKGSQNAFVTRGGAGRQVGGEPVASGVQPSNITSAIRSQAISSTAAAPGAKAGTSKEVHGLQRKVLEKNSGSASLGQASSHRMTDFHTVVKEDPTGKAAKRKIKEKLDLIEEDPAQKVVDEIRQAKTACNTKSVEKPVEKKKAEKRDGKLGYCENCMETFGDFNEVRP